MPIRLPEGVTRWAIRGARVPACLVEVPAGPSHEGLVEVDIVVEGGLLASIAPSGTVPVDAALPVLDRPGLVLPCFVDAHTHLDKGHITPRAENPDGTHRGALEAVGRDRQANWSAADVRARMEFSLQSAYAHGTRAIRTHIDSIGPQIGISWPVFAEVREAWAGRVELQASPLFGIDFALDDTHIAAIAAMVGRFGTCLGAVTYPGPTVRAGLQRLFRLASDKGWELDFHADETNDTGSNTLALIAETALATGFEGRVLAGHCCSLALMEPDEAKRTIDLVARAGLSIVSLPMCNMYLQDRAETPRTPRWRGITAIKELRQAGVPVLIASDNTRDPFYAYGDLDMAEVFREGTRIAQFDHPYGTWIETVTATPAEAIGLDRPARLRTGDPADLVLVPARNLSELLSRPASDRTVVRNGRPIEAAAPPYRDLDQLEGLRP